MKISRVWRTAASWSVCCVMLWAACASPARAQENTAPAADQPVVVINVASVERLLQGADLAFDSAGRPELSETMSGWLANANDLKGLNRDGSMGLMIFLNGLSPEFVAYVPLKNIDDLLKTIAQGPVTTKNTGNGEYEIVGPRQILYVRVKGDYAFVANSTVTLDRSLPDPAKITGRLSANYDFAISANLGALPKSSRDIFLGLLRGRADADLQRRDNEPEGAYKVRRAAGRNNLRIMEQLLTQGEEFLIGWSVSSQGRNAGLEVVVRAAPGTEMANAMNTLGSARSHFGNVIASNAPLTMAVSWKFDKPDRQTFREMLEGAELEVLKGVPADGANAGLRGPMSDLFAVLKNTADAGHLDGVMQLVRAEDGQPYALVGGMKVADAAASAAALSALMAQIKDNPQEQQRGTTIQLNAASHRDVVFHRVQRGTVPARETQRYGENPGLYLGAGEGVLWYAVGGEAAVPALRKMMDAAAQPAPVDVATPPFLLVANFSRMMDFIAGESTNADSALVRDAFAKGGDALRIDVRPVQDGMRVRLQFDEAFLRLGGQAFGRQVDRRQQAVRDRELRRQQRQQQQQQQQ